MRKITERIVLLIGLLCSLSIQAESSSHDELTNLVKQDCGSCHGMTLKGGLGPDLRPESVARYPEEALAAIIREGVPGTAMPPWKALLSNDEIRWISRQLRAGAFTAPPSDE